MTFTMPAPPPPHMSCFQASLSGPSSESFQSFQRSPPFGFSVTTDSPQGINNDRSLMGFAIIMQHANMAYHVQRAYKEPTIWLLRGGGGWYGWFQKKTSWSAWSLILSTRKILQGNVACHTIALYVREKYSITRGSGKKFLRKPITHPYPAQSQMAGP